MTKNELCSAHKSGDIVKISTMAYAYQDFNPFVDYFETNRLRLGIVLQRNEFIEKPKDPNDCEDIDDGSHIQEPYWVYTILCKGRKIEVLDVDITHLVEEV